VAKTVAVVGATGAVGADMLRVLEERNFPVKSIRMLASARSVGKTLKFNGKEYAVEELTHDSFKGIDIALFSAGADRSKEFAASAVMAGAVVVDNSSAFRMDKDVPLIVPEVNARRIKDHKGIIANPNCSTIIAVVPLWPIHQAAKIERLVASTYQAVSGTGAKAIEELALQARQILDGKPIKPEIYPYQIAFNVLPHIGGFLANGYTQEEMKLVHETRKIMEDDSIRITATTIRVPVFRAHSEALNLKTKKKLTVAQVREILSHAPGVTVVDDLVNNRYPMPVEASGQGNIFVGRIREDISQDNGLDLWISGDQLLKGAALNAVQIAEYLL
jgi:aspartate-semialdehyde dehydrogenase